MSMTTSIATTGFVALVTSLVGYITLGWVELKRPEKLALVSKIGLIICSVATAYFAVYGVVIDLLLTTLDRGFELAFAYSLGTCNLLLFLVCLPVLAVFARSVAKKANLNPEKTATVTKTPIKQISVHNPVQTTTRNGSKTLEPMTEASYTVSDMVISPFESPPTNQQAAIVETREKNAGQAVASTTAQPSSSNLCNLLKDVSPIVVDVGAGTPFVMYVHKSVFTPQQPLAISATPVESAPAEAPIISEVPPVELPPNYELAIQAPLVSNEPPKSMAPETSLVNHGRKRNREK